MTRKQSKSRAYLKRFRPLEELKRIGVKAAEMAEENDSSAVFQYLFGCWRAWDETDNGDIDVWVVVWAHQRKIRHRSVHSDGEQFALFCALCLSFGPKLKTEYAHAYNLVDRENVPEAEIADWLRTHGGLYKTARNSGLYKSAVRRASPTKAVKNRQKSPQARKK